jgi:acyl-CoA thioester hydrolase
MHAPLPATGPFHTPIRVRYADTDAAGVVYYANYLVYFEVARVEALRAVGMPITEVERRGVTLPAVSAACTYHSPAHVDDLLDVAMWTEHIARASFGFGYKVRRVAEGTLIASGATRHAVVARDTMRPVRIEGWIAELVARAQEWRPPS